MVKKWQVLFFVVIMLAGTALLFGQSGHIYAQDIYSGPDIDSCKSAMNKLISHLKNGGSNEGAKKFFGQIPPKDFLGSQVPYNEFISELRKRISWGWQINMCVRKMSTHIELDFGNSADFQKFCQTGRQEGTYYPMRICFYKYPNGWKIYGLWTAYDPGESTFSNYGIDSNKINR